VKKLDEYLKIAEAAEFLGVSVNTLRKTADKEERDRRGTPDHHTNATSVAEDRLGQCD
jgi:hypothetical protein